MEVKVQSHEENLAGSPLKNSHVDVHVNPNERGVHKMQRKWDQSRLEEIGQTGEAALKTSKQTDDENNGNAKDKQNMPNNAKDKQNMTKSAKDKQNMPKNAKDKQNMPKNAKNKQNMPKNAKKK